MAISINEHLHFTLVSICLILYIRKPSSFLFLSLAELTLVVCDTPERARKLIKSRTSYPELKNIVLVSPQGELEHLRSLAAGDIKIILFDDLLVSDHTVSRILYVDVGLLYMPIEKFVLYFLSDAKVLLL